MNTAKTELLAFMYKVAKIETLPEFCQVFKSDEEEMNDFFTNSEFYIPIPWLTEIFTKIETDEERARFNEIHIRLFPEKLKDPVFYSGMGVITSDRPGYTVPRRSPGYKAPQKRQ